MPQILRLSKAKRLDKALFCRYNIYSQSRSSFAIVHAESFLAVHYARHKLKTTENN